MDFQHDAGLERFRQAVRHFLQTKVPADLKGLQRCARAPHAQCHIGNGC